MILSVQQGIERRDARSVANAHGACTVGPHRQPTVQAPWAFTVPSRHWVCAPLALEREVANAFDAALGMPAPPTPPRPVRRGFALRGNLADDDLREEASGGRTPCGNGGRAR